MWWSPVEILSQLSRTTLAGASFNHKIVSLWLPQVLQLLSLCPVPHFLLPRLVQLIDDQVLPSIKAILVHEPALTTARVVADQLHAAGRIKYVLTLATSQTLEILTNKNQF